MSNCVLTTYHICTTERRVRSRAAPGPGGDPGGDPGDAKKLFKRYENEDVRLPGGLPKGAFLGFIVVFVVCLMGPDFGF